MSASAQAARSLELVRPLAFFDLETTGIDVAADRIAEIAVRKLLPDGTEPVAQATPPGLDRVLRAICPIGAVPRAPIRQSDDIGLGDTNCLLYTSDAADEEDSVDLG